MGNERARTYSTLQWSHFTGAVFSLSFASGKQEVQSFPEGEEIVLMLESFQPF